MTATAPGASTTGGHGLGTPSPWVLRFLPRLPAGGHAVDVASGLGRHARVLAAAGLRVTAVDRDGDALASLAAASPAVTTTEHDLGARGWPFGATRFDAVVVTNYLHRPLLPALVDAVGPGGWLIYETFAIGNARFGRPSNPDFLLRAGELLDAVRGRLRVIAFEDLEVDLPKPACVQRIAARAEPNG
jgi:SAM-dependent methyltransferase